MEVYLDTLKGCCDDISGISFPFHCSSEQRLWLLIRIMCVKNLWPIIRTPFMMVFMRRQSKCLPAEIQSTLVISKSKGPSETVRDIRTSTYQICSIEEKNNLNNQILQMTMLFDSFN